MRLASYCCSTRHMLLPPSSQEGGGSLRADGRRVVQQPDAGTAAALRRSAQAPHTRELPAAISYDCLLPQNRQAGGTDGFPARCRPRSPAFFHATPMSGIKIRKAKTTTTPMTASRKTTKMNMNIRASSRPGSEAGGTSPSRPCRPARSAGCHPIASLLEAAPTPIACS